MLSDLRNFAENFYGSSPLFGVSLANGLYDVVKEIAMSPQTLRRTLNVLITLALIFSSVGNATAAPNNGNDGIYCVDGQVIISILDFRPVANQTKNVVIDGQVVGTIQFDGNGNAHGSYSVPGKAQIEDLRLLGGGYDLIFLQRGSKSPIPCTTSKPAGPFGNQGQNVLTSTANFGNAHNSGVVGDPVSTSIGEYFFTLPLMDLGCPLPLTFSLIYAANLDKSIANHNDPFGGDNFSHNFHIALRQTNDTSLTIFFGNGNLVTFQKAEGKWQVKGEETAYQLIEINTRYYFLNPITQIIFTFDKAKSGNANIGILKRIEDRNGNALTLTTDAAGLVTRLDDGKGRALIFTYATPTNTANWTWPHLTQVADSNNRVITFEYKVTSEAPMTMHLISVTDPLKQTTKFTHDGAITNTVISAVTHPLGNIPYTNKYEVISNQWTVTNQTDALGNVTTLKIDRGVTTMTDPLGNDATHTQRFALAHRLEGC